MSSVSRLAVCGTIVAAAVAAFAARVSTDHPHQAVPPLRVCADPNNLPFSNDRGEGFENQIAELAARDLGRPLTYTWWPQRRGFARHTLGAGLCDVIVGLPSAYDMAWTTRPYYRSTYVFVSRHDRHLAIRSFDDPRLRRLTIGLHVVGDDYSNVPPAQALANRSIVGNVRGYSLYADYSKPNPPAELMTAVERGDVDVAIAWGPLAGYFARRAATALDIAPVSPESEAPMLTFVFDIAMGVRRGDTALHDRLNDLIARRGAAIQTILDRFGIPTVGRIQPGPKT
jgi:quinoprotein dehydrogenase-associated probable ABC transporter substrate-binding protein